MKRQLFKLNDGPWKKLFEGDFQGMPVELYRNPDNFLLVVIYDQGKKKVNGAVVQLHYPFLGKGSLEALIESVPKELLLFEKRLKGQTVKWLLISSQAEYLKWKEASFQKEFAKQLKEMKNYAKTMKGHAKGYSVGLKPLNECTREVQATFFNEPILVPALAGKLPKEEKKKALGGKAIDEDIILGKDKADKVISENMTDFSETLVEDGKEGDRKHVLHVLAESALLSHLALTILDWEDDFQGLATSTKRLKELKEAGIDVEPIGFPVKHFYPFKELKVDINLLGGTALTTLFGVGNERVVGLIREKLRMKNYSGFPELIEEVKKEKASEKVNQYEIFKAARVLQLIDQRYPDLFGANNPTGDVSSLWMKGMGRAGIVHLDQMPDRRSRLMLIHSLLKGVKEYYEDKGVSRELKALVVIPQAEKLVGLEKQTVLQQEMVKTLKELNEFGVGFILETNHAIELDEEITDQAKSVVSLVKGLDAAVRIEGKKRLRLEIRPTLSTSAEELS